jgi:hypothetical protein|tara:strand:- start:279 stop:506 length:228 start_codon:yes stop_codon:yes gene_type:complete
MNFLGDFKVLNAHVRDIEDLLDWHTQTWGRGVDIRGNTWDAFQDGSDVLIEVYGNDTSLVQTLYGWIEDEGFDLS